MSYEWFCDEWQYSEKNTVALEAAYSAANSDLEQHVLPAVKPVKLVIEGFVYDVDVVRMQQTNRKTGFLRSVKRRIAADDDAARKAAEADAARLAAEKAAGSGVAGGFPRVLLVSGGGNIACNGQYELTAQVSGSCRRPIYAHLDESGVSIRWSQAGEMWVFDHPDGSPYKCDDRDDIAAPLDGWSCFGTNLLGRGKAPVIAAASEDELSGLALMRAARSNDIAAVREILARPTNSAPPEAVTFQELEPHGGRSPGDTALIVAAKQGQVDMLRLLIEKGAELETRDHGLRSTALAWAACNRHAACVRALCDAGADLDGLSHVSGNTPLLWCGSSASCLSELLKGGADPLIPDDNGEDLFDAIARYSADEDCETIDALLRSSSGAGAFSLRFFFGSLDMQHYWHRFDRHAELALLAATLATTTQRGVKSEAAARGTTDDRPAAERIVHVENAGSRYEVTGIHREGGVWKAIRCRAERASDAIVRPVIGVERMVDAVFSTTNEPGVCVTRSATKAEVEPSRTGCEWSAKVPAAENASADDFVYRAAKASQKLGRHTAYWEVVVTRPVGGLAAVGVSVPGFEARDRFWGAWEGVWAYGCSAEVVLIAPPGVEQAHEQAQIAADWRYFSSTKFGMQAGIETTLLRATVGVLVDRSGSGGENARLSFFVNGAQVLPSINVELPDDAVPMVCLTRGCAARFVSLVPPWRDLAAAAAGGGSVEAEAGAEAVVGDDRSDHSPVTLTAGVADAELALDSCFDVLAEPLPPTLAVGSAGGLRGVRRASKDVGGGIGAALLVPAGALSGSTELAIERAAAQEVDTLKLDGIAASAVIRFNCSDAAAGEAVILAPVTVRLQHTKALLEDATSIPEMRVLTRQQGSGGVFQWTRVSDEQCAVHDHHIDVSVREGSLPTHLAVVTETKAESDMYNATALAYSLMPPSAAVAAAAANLPNLIVWVAPDRDDVRSAIAARMKRRKQETGAIEGSWQLCSESLEQLIVSPGSTNIVCKCTDSEQPEQTRPYKTKGVALHLVLKQGTGPARVLVRSDSFTGDEVELFALRPPVVLPMATPPPPQIVRRAVGGSVTVWLEKTGHTHIVEVARLSIRDCVRNPRGTKGADWRLPLATDVDPARFVATYEGSGPEVTLEGVFGAYIGVRSVNTVGHQSERSELLVVPPNEPTEPSVNNVAPARGSQGKRSEQGQVLSGVFAEQDASADNLTRLLLYISNAATAARVCRTSCQTLKHRAHAAVAALANTIDDGATKEGILLATALQNVAKLIDSCAAAGWLALLLTPQPMLLSRFLEADSALFALVETGGSKDFVVDEPAIEPACWYDSSSSAEDTMVRQWLIDKVRAADDQEATGAISSIDAAAFAADLGLPDASHEVGRELKHPEFITEMRRLAALAAENKASVGGPGRRSIYVSHVATGTVLTEKLIAALASRGFTAYMLDNSVRAGSCFEKIQDGIHKCACFLAVVSPSYGSCASSRWTYRELCMASDAAKLVIPIWHSGTFPGPLGLAFSGASAIDFRNYKDDSIFSDCIEQLCVRFDKAGMAIPISAVRQDPDSQTPPLKTSAAVSPAAPRSQSGSESLQEWLDRLRLGHAASALAQLGVELLEDLQVSNSPFDFCR